MSFLNETPVSPQELPPERRIVPLAMLTVPWLVTAPLSNFAPWLNCMVPVLISGPLMNGVLSTLALTSASTVITPALVIVGAPMLGEPQLEGVTLHLRVIAAPLAMLSCPPVATFRLVFGPSAEICRVGLEPAPPIVIDFATDPPVITTV